MANQNDELVIPEGTDKALASAERSLPALKKKMRFLLEREDDEVEAEFGSRAAYQEELADTMEAIQRLAAGPSSGHREERELVARPGLSGKDK